MEMLLKNEGLTNATDVLFIGDSTGGIASAHFLDELHQLVRLLSLCTVCTVPGCADDDGRHFYQWPSLELLYDRQMSRSPICGC